MARNLALSFLSSLLLPSLGLPSDVPLIRSSSPRCLQTGLESQQAALQQQAAEARRIAQDSVNMAQQQLGEERRRADESKRKAKSYCEPVACVSEGGRER